MARLRAAGAASAAAAAAAGRNADPRPRRPLRLVPEDYPAEALRDGHEGTVAFRLEVGADGRVRRCDITGTSGSAALNSATCRIMTERPRFAPGARRPGRSGARPGSPPAPLGDLPEPEPEPEPGGRPAAA